MKGESFPSPLHSIDLCLGLDQAPAVSVAIRAYLLVQLLLLLDTFLYPTRLLSQVVHLRLVCFYTFDPFQVLLLSLFDSSHDSLPIPMHSLDLSQEITDLLPVPIDLGLGVSTCRLMLFDQQLEHPNRVGL